MAKGMRGLFTVACVVAVGVVVVASAAFAVNADGANAKQVTRPPTGIVDDQPEWAPDGRLIAFTRCAPSALCHVWVTAPDGTDLAPVGPLCPEGANEQTCPDDEHA